MEKYIRGMVATIKMEVRLAGTLADSTSATCRVHDPTGTKIVSDQAMTKTATGKYEYEYDINDDAMTGIYTAIVFATVSSKQYSSEETFGVDWK